MIKQKIIHGSLDEIVEAVMQLKPVYNNPTKKEWAESIRTAIERFVVEEDGEDYPAEIEEFANDVIYLKGLILSGKYGLFDKYKKELIEKINDLEYTTPKKGGDDEA